MKAIDPDISIDAIRQRLCYDPETGLFTWVSGKRVGRLAGSLKKTGYVVIGSVGRRYIGAHRLAWAMCHGRFPAAEIDHINGKRDDNRIANLREATRQQNAQNRPGAAGVTLHKRTGKWQAQIRIAGRTHYLGVFRDRQEAEQAYRSRRDEAHPFARKEHA